MNLLIILGIIAIAIGTYLTFLGVFRRSNVSENRILKEIERTQKQTESKIDNILTADELSVQQREEIKLVRNEFDDWAKNLKNNLEKKKIEYQKAELDNKEERFELNIKWRYLYVNYFDGCRKIIEAINKNSEYNIEYSFPDLPENIFLENYEKYFATIDFKNNIQWQFSFTPAKGTDQSLFPSIFIYIIKSSENSRAEWLDAFSILFHPEEKTFRTILLLNNYLNVDAIDMKRWYNEPFDLNQMDSFMKSIVELQLIKDY